MQDNMGPTTHQRLDSLLHAAFFPSSEKHLPYSSDEHASHLLMEALRLRGWAIRIQGLPPDLPFFANDVDEPEMRVTRPYMCRCEFLGGNDAPDEEYCRKSGLIFREFADMETLPLALARCAFAAAKADGLIRLDASEDDSLT